MLEIKKSVGHSSKIDRLSLVLPLKMYSKFAQSYPKVSWKMSHSRLLFELHIRHGVITIPPCIFLIPDISDMPKLMVKHFQLPEIFCYITINPVLWVV